MPVLMSLVGVLTVLTLALLLSGNRRQIKLRTVAVAFLVQAAVAAFARARS